MLANISTPPTPSVTAWLRCTIIAALPSARPSIEGGRPQRAGDVERRLQSDLGQIDHLAQGAGLGDPHPADVEVEVEVGVDDPARRAPSAASASRPSAAAAAPCARRSRTSSGTRSQSGVVSRISSVMIPERVRGLASPRCSIWSTGLSSSGGPAASSSGASLMAAATLPSLLLLPCGSHIHLPTLVRHNSLWRTFSAREIDSPGAAPVAQRIEQPPSKRSAAGSSPAGGAV